MRKTKSQVGRSSDLFEAVLTGALTDLKRVAKQGINLDITKDSFTPLMIACSNGNFGIADFLITHGANVNWKNSIGQTPLMLAARSGNKALVEQLLAAGAEVRAFDQEQRNALTWAINGGDFPEVISRLVVSGADYDQPDIRGITPLMRAALLGYTDSVAILLTVGADETRRADGMTAYEMAAKQGHQEVCQTVITLLKNRPHSNRQKHGKHGDIHDK